LNDFVRRSRLVLLVYRVLADMPPPADKMTDGEILGDLAWAFMQTAAEVSEAERTRKKKRQRGASETEDNGEQVTRDIRFAQRRE
jgi:hypothetical protein